MTTNFLFLLLLLLSFFFFTNSCLVLKSLRDIFGIISFLQLDIFAAVLIIQQRRSTEVMNQIRTEIKIFLHFANTRISCRPTKI